MIAVDSSRQKKLDADLKTIDEIKFAGQSKNVYGLNADGPEYMFIIFILENIKETPLEPTQRRVAVL